MTLRKQFFPSLLSLLLVFVLNSCQPRNKYCVLKIKIECTPSLYVDSLKTILLTDTYADFGGKSGSDFFGPGRVVGKNVKRSSDNYFYLQKVKKAQYAILYMEGYQAGVLYTGKNRAVNFSETKGDTAEIEICYEPNMKMINSKGARRDINQLVSFEGHVR